MFYKYMKFPDNARLCLAIYDFESQCMLSIICLNSHGKPMFNINVTLKCDSIFSGFYFFTIHITHYIVLSRIIIMLIA